MKLKPFAELIGATKEAVAKALAPMRARKVKAKAELEMAKLDERIVCLESEVQEECAKEDINFDTLMKKLDEAALIERRQKQYKKVLAELFPE
jgi:DNA-binding sugar fermentation-stimulating protein